VIRSRSQITGWHRTARKIAAGVVLPLAISAAAFGGPVSQLLRVAETRAHRDETHAHYELVISAGLHTRSRIAEAKQASHDKTSKSDAQPRSESARLLTAVTDSWDASGGISLPIADAPALPELPLADATTPEIQVARCVEPRLPPTIPNILSRPPPSLS
jgi:hypothetical protein